MTKRLRTCRSFPEECSARVELVQVENPPLEPQPGTLVRRGSNQRYEPMELSDLGCSPNDNVFDQYATPLDMERELGEYEIPLNVKQRDLSQLSGQDINEAEKIFSANSKRWNSPTASSNKEIQEKKEVSGIYCNSDRLPIGHKRQDTKETEKTSVTADNSDTPLTMSYTQLDNETGKRIFLHCIYTHAHTHTHISIYIFIYIYIDSIYIYIYIMLIYIVFTNA